MHAPRPLVAAINAILLSGFAGHSFAAVDTTGLVYTPITPCRIVDTRVTGGPFAAKETRTYSTNGAAAQGGGACTVYSGTIPAALSLNVTVDATALGNPTHSGYLNLTQAPGSPGSSWMNFVGGQTVANAGVASINTTDGSFAIKTQNQANVVIDVFGYFSQVATGSSGISSFVANDTFAGGMPINGQLGFFGATQLLTTTAAQTILGTSSATMQFPPETPSDTVVYFSLCYRVSTGEGDPIPFENGKAGLGHSYNVVPGAFLNVSTSMAAQPGAGLWAVGMCGRTGTNIAGNITGEQGGDLHSWFIVVGN